MKKLSLLISTLALFFCFAFSVNAAGENAQTAVPIQLNDSLIATLNGEDYEYYFKFTPSKTAYYEVLITGNGSKDAELYIIDSKGEYLASSDWNQYTNTNKVAYKLTANNTYYFEVEYWGSSNVYLTTTVKNHSHSFKAYDITKADEYNIGYIMNECSVCEATSKTSIPKVVVSLSKEEFTYNGKTQKPTVIVKDTAGKVFKEGTDYTVIYPNASINADLYEISVEMINSKYDVSSNLYYDINEKPINKSAVKLSKTTVSYGEMPTVSITGLKKNKDFECDIWYWGMGSRTITVYGIGNYTGSVDVTFKVIPAKISGLKISKTTSSSIKLSWKSDSYCATDYYQIYDIAKGKIIATVDSYTTSYTVKKLKAGKKYSYKVRGYSKENGEKYYGEWKTIEASTLPKSTTLSSVKSEKKKTLTVKWKKQSAATGYQVQYSTNSKFKKGATKTLTIKKNKQISSKISKLKSGKKYYVKVRTYKTLKINGKSTKVYSAWSSVKSAKVK